MTVKKQISRMVGLTGQSLEVLKPLQTTRVTALTTTADEIKRLWSQDTVGGRARLSRAGVREIVGEANTKCRRRCGSWVR